MATRSRLLSSFFVAPLVILVISIARAANANNDASIEYWTNYAILPKKCIKYNNADQIMFSIYEKYSNHCTDTPTGIYVASVPSFVNAYLAQLADNAADAGQEYAYPDAYNYASCRLRQFNGVNYYLQLGCSDDSSSSSSSGNALAVNIYSDADCTTPSVVDGYDDSNVQVDFSINFNKCTPCVIWSDKNDDEIDDQYYMNKQTSAPLCSSMWEYKQTCNDKCQLMAKENGRAREGWNQADKVLLSILSLFGLGMLIAIIKRRQKMSNKDSLLEQAAISAAGLQQSHILGMFALLILIITIFGLLGLKKITWALLLVLNIVLFAYLMKLTVDGSVKETIIGPDGKIANGEASDDEEDDDDDDEDPASPKKKTAAGEYENPELPAIS